MGLLADEENRKRYAQGAAIDVKRRNAKNTDLYSKEQKDKADGVRTMLDNAYFGAKVYPPNYRDKFIAVKVEKPGQNQFRAEVRELNKTLEAHGVIIRKTAANSFIYQLPEDFGNISH